MKKLLAVISGLALLASTCPAWSAPVDAFKDLKGSLDIAGGTAHIPVMKAAAKAIMEANPNIHITVAGGRLGRWRSESGRRTRADREYRPCAQGHGDSQIRSQVLPLRH